MAAVPKATAAPELRIVEHVAARLPTLALRVVVAEAQLLAAVVGWANAGRVVALAVAGAPVENLAVGLRGQECGDDGGDGELHVGGSVVEWF